MCGFVSYLGSPIRLHSVLLNPLLLHTSIDGRGVLEQVPTVSGDPELKNSDKELP
jgi:hypothetical protein